jgi:hypothetical protein
MSAPFNEGSDNLADSIGRYGFAAAIEVTNSLSEVEREDKKTHRMIRIDVCEAKTKQVRFAKQYLEHLTKGQAGIVAGIAYNGDLVDPRTTHGLDFLIDINCYNPTRLEKVADEMRGSRYLIPKEKRLLEEIMKSYCPDLPLATFFTHSQIRDCSQHIGISAWEYQLWLPGLKGLCMELYIKDVFDEELEDKLILHRQQFRFKKDRYSEEKSSEADNVVICRKKDFYEAIKKIELNDEFITWVNSSSIDYLAS